MERTDTRIKPELEDSSQVLLVTAEKWPLVCVLTPGAELQHPDSDTC